MAMNTPYLGSSVSVPGNLNTSYLSTGITEISSAVSVWGQFESMQTTTLDGATILKGALQSASAASFGAITGTTEFLTSTASINGAVTLGSTLSVRGLADFNSTRTQSGTLSYQTTASATSLILPDGGFGVYFLSATSMALAFRSGNTTYTVRATAASVL